MNRIYQCGMTLLELTVVLLLLIALAGLAVPYVSGTSSKALCEATDVSMQNLKNIIMDRYYLDTLGRYPASTYSSNDYNLNALFAAPTAAQSYNPDTKTGWRGPYVQNGVTLGPDSSEIIFKAGNLNPSFTDKTKGYVHDNLIDGQSVVLDGWGRPIIIQVNNGLYGARLVSAGPGHGPGFLTEDGAGSWVKDGIDTLISSASAQNDDRVLNLKGTTPANTPCDQL